MLSRSRRMQNANIKSEGKTFDFKTGELWVSKLLPIIFSPRRSSGRWNIELTSHYDLFNQCGKKNHESIDICQIILLKMSCRTIKLCIRKRHQGNTWSGSREFFSSIFPKTALHCWNTFSGTLNANKTTPPKSTLKDRKNSRSIEFFRFFHRSCPRDSKSVDRTTSLSTCLTNGSKYERNGYQIFT